MINFSQIITERKSTLERDMKYRPLSELKENIQLNPKYFRLLDALIKMLKKDKYIKIEGDNIITLSKSVSKGKKFNDIHFEQEKKELESEYPDLKPHINLLFTCLKSYPQLLRGELDSMEVMFPGGSKELVSGIYRGDETTRYFNKTIAKIIGNYTRFRIIQDKNVKINILEIGAGTGGTSESVLKALEDKSNNISYSYTDISSSFTLDGKKKYGSKYPFSDFFILFIDYI